MTAATIMPDATAPAVDVGVRTKSRRMPGWLVSWLQVGPLALILLLFFVVPLIGLVVISFFDYGRIDIYPDFILTNYTDLLTSNVTLRLYANTLKYCVITLACTLVLGFFVAYYTTFHIRTARVRIALLTICSIPFFTSMTIRMITWLPFLGRNGLLNNILVNLGIVGEPLEFLLFSDFAVILAYVNIFTLMMMMPILNSMAKIDRSLIAAARDAGASEWQIIRDLIIPLSKSGIAIGSVLVVTQVMADFFIVRTLSGGQSAGVVSGMQTQLAGFEYPPAAASAVILLIVILLFVGIIFRFADVRKELSG